VIEPKAKKDGATFIDMKEILSKGGSPPAKTEGVALCPHHQRGAKVETEF